MSQKALPDGLLQGLYASRVPLPGCSGNDAIQQQLCRLLSHQLASMAIKHCKPAVVRVPRHAQLDVMRVLGGKKGEGKGVGKEEGVQEGLWV
jgi:hypothetical protein